jgi:hypothetical protein
LRSDITSSELSVVPQQGCIRAGSNQELELTINPEKKNMYEIPVKTSIPGGKGLSFNVIAKVDVPSVSVSQVVTIITSP